MIQILKKIFKFLSSLKFAVINLVHLAFLSAVGAFLESHYDHVTARELVYNSLWLSGALILLSINLLMVLIHRWPWKKHHTGFVMAHFGILILIAGSLITRLEGVDGSLRLIPEKSSRSIILPSEIFVIYSSDGDDMTEIHHSKKPFFFFNPPTKEKPYTLFLEKQEPLHIINYHPYALSRVVYQPDPKGNTAIRFRLSGERANVVDWIYKKNLKPFFQKKIGLAELVISDGSYTPQSPNELIFVPSKELSYTLVSKGKIRQKGVLKKGDQIQTGWMDLTFHLLDFFKARQVYEFHPQKESGDQTISAIQIKWGDQQQWLGLNSSVAFYKKDQAFIFGYMNERLNLGFDLRLNEFKIKRYPGSVKAKEYESSVTVDGFKKVLISMNEPLKYRGWTFYQSSFEEDDQGRIQSSILSVNKDPGRWIKYCGSFFVVLGIFFLFYLRKNHL